MVIQTLPSNAHRKQPLPAIAGHRKEYILQQHPSHLSSFFAPGNMLHDFCGFAVLGCDQYGDYADGI
jgi:hypothetical protein